MFEKSFITDCEGPLTLNDNAFELCEHFIDDGDKLFKILSLYDDYLVDIVKKEGYKAGNTLKLILPFFVLEKLTNDDLIDFSKNHIYAVRDSKFLLKYLKETMNTYIVSTSYGQYIEAVSNYMWDDAYGVYFNDKYGIGVSDWLKTGNNNYAFISSAGTMLTAAYEGYWKTDSATISDIANQWAEAVIANGVACCDCSCGNIAMMKWAVDFINPDLLAKFADQVFQATNHNFFNPANFQNNPNTDTADGSEDEKTGMNSTNANVMSNSSSSTLQSDSATSGLNRGNTARGVGETSSQSATAASASEINDLENTGETGADSSSKSYEVEKSVSSSSTTTESLCLYS